MFDRGNKKDCWIWKGAPNSVGYGTIREGGRYGKTLQAHRVSFLFHNAFLPDYLDVCHRCDVRLCVNPYHLFLGTHADNNKDRDNKGRCKSAGKPGELCGQAKLKNSQVLAIRNDGRIHRLIAKDYGVARSTITRIKLGKTAFLKTLNLWKSGKPASQVQETREALCAARASFPNSSV